MESFFDQKSCAACGASIEQEARLWRRERGGVGHEPRVGLGQEEARRGGRDGRDTSRGGDDLDRGRFGEEQGHGFGQEGREVPLQARPAAQFSGTPVEFTRGGPALGEHTIEVLSDLGYSADEIAEITGTKKDAAE